MKFSSAILCTTALLTLTACNSGIETEAKYPTGYERTTTNDDIYGEREGVFGKGGIFGSKEIAGPDTGITVNSYLWRAALDVVSFMPLASADPFGGTLITDWYSPSDNVNERFKLNVFILSRQLRSDGIEVRVFKQELRAGSWRDATPSTDMELQLEDAILTRARQLRVAAIGE